jgi:uridine kinase
MNQPHKLDLFISYSHLDEELIDQFRKHITPLKTNGLINDWYDRKTIAGQDFQGEIDNNLENADIVCLFISANFLSSENCMKEKHNAFDLMKRKGIVVISIILSACAWKDDIELSSLLALPTDGKPISDFPNSNNAWMDVYEGLKVVIEKEIKIKRLEITKEFSSFLEDTELFSKAHSQKEKVQLDDIFVYPGLDKYSTLRDYEETESSEKLVEKFCDYSKILISGENQSGKTTLCKIIFLELRKINFVPVYITDTNKAYKGRIENRIIDAYNEQYENVPIDDIDKQRIVPILDDFHFARKKEKHIKELAAYQYQIIIVDDIFSLNFKDETLINAYTHFRIKEFVASLRNELISKWTQLSDKETASSQNEIELYERLDTTTELVNTILGKAIGSGIMPAYPFFILSVLSTYETFEKPLDQEITSQGYCYQALIYFFLRKQGVKNDEFDTYINFLTEFAFYLYTAKKVEISCEEFDSFMESYLSRFYLPVDQDNLLKNLEQTGLIDLDNLKNFSFGYQYLYYFFVAKYLADNIDDNKEIIDSIINNLHKDENSYVAVFISHHSKDSYILDEILLNAYCLFDGYTPATLSTQELDFFDAQANHLIQAVLPDSSSTPEKERAKALEEQDLREEIEGENDISSLDESDEDELAVELRRSVKTVEVMGSIIKNRVGSLEKAKLEIIFEEAMKTHLRALNSFIELIKDEESQLEIVEFITNRLNKIIEDEAEERMQEGKKEREPSIEKLEEISKKIFWNVNLFIMYGLIDKIVHSLGSNKLTEIINKICDNENTPASFIVKHGNLMWYNKNLQVQNIADRINEDDFSESATHVLKMMVVNHSTMHPIGFKEKQKIENKLGIPLKRLLIAQTKRIDQQ